MAGHDVIDLRSDTLTQPTAEMREAMARAEVGDDVWGEDPTVQRLEALAAERLGKDAGLFVASGTQGNLLSVLAQTQPGQEVVLDADAHIFNNEVAGASVGSVICGRTELIARARRLRKMLGGGMRQAGVIAAAGIVALEGMVDRLVEDHANARALAEGVARLPRVRVDLASVQTNIVI